MGVWFNFQVWLGKKLKVNGAPVCRVFNDVGTEHYTLTNDGWVLIQGVQSKSVSAIPIQLASANLVSKFEAALAKNC
jgi:hypothetical protein